MWLIASFYIEGLQRDGTPINETGWLGIDRRPRTQTKWVSSNPSNPNARQVSVTEYITGFGISNTTFDGGLPKYTIEWNIDTLNEMLKHTIYSPGLKFVKEGVSSPPAIIADSLEQFIEETPEIVFNRYTKLLPRKINSNQHLTWMISTHI